jgi:type II secretory ATPase GspE/PulE/Tfp pilus assembly ATPase PilB-like protein/CheY-like chemotaxis protein
MTQPSSSSHWLTDVAAHAGLELRLQQFPDLSTLRKAWRVVATACKATDDQLAQRVARHFRLGVADLSTWDPQAVALLPERVARTHGILPLSLDNNNLVVATSDPANRDARQDIVSNAGRQPVFLMASPPAISQAIDRAYAPVRSARSTLQTLVTEAASNDFQLITSQGIGTGAITRFELEAPAVVKLTDIILQQAGRYRASEIHLEPGRETGRVRYRIDGVLQQFLDLPVQAHSRIVARLKSMAVRPSATTDGPAGSFTLPGKGGSELDAQLQSTTTPDGERVTIRITDPKARPTLGELGFDGPEGKKLRELLGQREGFILVAAPARSGKTSLVYAALTEVRGLNIVSLENPVEVQLPGVTQVQYDPASGAYAEALQQLLGLDPDLIHAGEIRDLATARTVLRAAVTGRRVLATVHTSDAVSGVRRLLDMGLAPGRLAESLRGVVSVRLLRRLCRSCCKEVKEPTDLPSRERQLAQAVGTLPARRAVGCPECGGTGFRGQIPLAEVLTLDPSLLAAIAEGSTGPELDQAARAQGMKTFLDVALERVARGQTTLQEVERVLGLIPQREATADSVGPVLVVEDEPDDRLLIRAVLQEVGFHIVEAEDGPPALELLESGDHDFCLVILDLFMPQMHGTEVLKRIRRSLSTQALPVIVLTASPNPRDEIELLEAGADDYLLKPIVADRLEARVRAVLRRSGVRLTEA